MGGRQRRGQNHCRQWVYQPITHVAVQCEPISRIDPATEEELGTVPEMGVVETKEAIVAAAKAFTTWSKTTAKVSLTFRLQ